MSSPYYFNFLASVWDQLPDRDREEFAELWMAYEQVMAAIYQKQLETNLNIGVADLQAYSTERWLPYTFNSTNLLARPATVTSTQDISVGVNLLSKYMLRFRVDGGPAIEVNVAGLNPQTTKIDEIISKINMATVYNFASAIFDNTILKLSSPTSGQISSIELLPTTSPHLNCAEYVLGLDPNDMPMTFPKFRYPYQFTYDRVASVPELRDAIRDETVTTTLIEGTDYIVEEGAVISFHAAPPEKMWAERTEVDEENPWYNYGFLTEIYQKNSPRYVGVLQGLWFSLWNGPKPSNVRTSLYLLFGLPTAPEDSTVTSVSPTIITLLGKSGASYSFNVPSGLDPDVVSGQVITKFWPLVTGIDVFDKINYPGFIEAEIGREGIQRFLTEDASRGFGDTDETKALRLLEEYTFLPQISVETFVYPDINLKNVKLFLDAFRPLNKTYLFQVIVGAFKDLLGVTDRISLHERIDLTSNLDWNETTDLQQSTLDAYEIINNDPLNLDPHGILFGDRLEIEVRSSGVLIDSFMA